MPINEGIAVYTRRAGPRSLFSGRAGKGQQKCSQRPRTGLTCPHNGASASPRKGPEATDSGGYMRQRITVVIGALLFAGALMEVTSVPLAGQQSRGTPTPRGVGPAP